MIQTLCFEGFRGVDTAMWYLEEAVRETRHVTLTDASGKSAETKFIVKHVLETEPPLVLFGGWCPLYDRIVAALPDDTPLACWWPSSPGQVGLAAEESTMLAVLANERLDEVLFMSSDFADVLSHPWLPAVVPATRFPQSVAAARTDPPNISLFCAADERARKNVTGCVLALMRVKEPFRLHLNGLSESPLHRQLLDDMAVDYVDHGWMEPDAYAKLCAEMSLGLQVSFAESNGFVVTEHLLRGVPVLASAMVPALDVLPADLRDAMTATAPDSPVRIARQIDALLRGEGLSADWRARARKSVLDANKKAMAQARRVLGPWS